MSQKEGLLKVKCLKSIFIFINYNYILKLIKNSKKFQGELGININNYKKQSSYKYIERNITARKIDRYEMFCLLSISFCITLIFFLYVFIYTIVLFAKGGFDDNNTKTNYNIKFFSKIKKLNISLFGFLGYIIVSYYIVFVWVPSNYYYDNVKKLILKKCSLILIAFIYFFYDVCIIIKLILSYKIKKNKTTWFMICDYLLIILISLYLIGIIFVIYYYYSLAGKHICILKEFQNIYIEDYKLPYDFKEKDDKEKRLYIFNKKKYYKIKPLNNDYYLLELINDLRKKKILLN